MTPHRHALPFVSALVLCAAPASADNVFYGVTDTSLIRFNMTTQAVTVIGPLTMPTGALTFLTDCDFDASGNLWATRFGNIGGFPPTTVSQAWRVNTSTGAGTLQGDFGSGATLYSLGFRPSNSTFYGVNNSGGTTTGHLVTINMTGGTVASATGSSDGLSPIAVEAAAFAPSGACYGVWNAGQPPFGGIDYKLVTFNLGTGQASVIGSIAPGLTFNALRFDASGTAYTVEVGSGNVYTVNTTTGAGTVLFAGGAAAAGTHGLAYVPGPGAWAMLGAGMVLGARRRRA